MELTCRAVFPDDVDIGATHTVKVTVDSSYNVPLSDVCIYVKRTTYYTTSGAGPETIPPFGSVTFTLHVRCWGCATIEDLTNFSVEIKAKTPANKEIVSSRHWTPKLVRFTRTFRARTPDGMPYYNILLFGEAGIGKSSAINGLLSLFTHDEEIDMSKAQVGGALGHVTRDLFFYRVANSNIRLVDVWGVDYDKRPNYIRGDLQEILSGALPGGWKMNSEPGEFRAELAEAAKYKEKRAIHAVIYFIAPGVVMDPAQAPRLARCQEFMDQFVEMRITPIVVIGRMDEYTKEPLGSPAYEKAVQQLKTATFNKFHVPEALIFPLSNYSKSLKRNFAMDKVYYRILLTAVNQAEGREARLRVPDLGGLILDD